MQYSPAQIADLLSIRQLFFTKLGHLRDARGAALDVLSECVGDLHETKVHTERMQALVEETYHTYLQFGAVCHFGVGDSMFAANVVQQSMPVARFPTALHAEENDVCRSIRPGKLLSAL